MHVESDWHRPFTYAWVCDWQGQVKVTDLSPSVRSREAAGHTVQSTRQHFFFVNCAHRNRYVQFYCTLLCKRGGLVTIQMFTTRWHYISVPNEKFFMVITILFGVLKWLVWIFGWLATHPSPIFYTFNSNNPPHFLNQHKD